MKIIVNWRAVHRFSPKWLLIVTKWLAQRSFKAGTAACCYCLAGDPTSLSKKSCHQSFPSLVHHFCASRAAEELTRTNNGKFMVVVKCQWVLLFDLFAFSLRRSARTTR